MKDKKTKEIHFRVTAEEYKYISEKADTFSSITSYVMSAIKECSNTSIRENLESRKQLAEIYKKFDEKLAHVGGNLNQAMRRINEAANAGYPYNRLLSDEFMPRVQECYALSMEMRKELLELTKNCLKR